MKILVSTTPGAGHVNPVVPLARALADLGHELTWVTSPSGCDSVAAMGFAARSAGLDVPERTSRLFALHPEIMTAAPRERRPNMFAGGFAEVAAPVTFDGLESAAGEVRPDLMLHEVAELAAPVIAAALGVPLVTVGFSGSLPAAVRSALRTAIEPMWAGIGREVPDDLGFGTLAYLHPFPPAFGQRPEGPKVVDARVVGDDRSFGRPAPTWLERLGQERPLVYMTFGTEVSHLMPWPTLIAGLAAADVDAVVTTGHAVDADALAAQLPDAARARIRIERYVPQSFVLPRAQLVVSHGGAGTVLASAAAGLPQIVVPIAADQFENADAVTSADVGIELELAGLTGPALADHLADVLRHTRFTSAAARVAEQIASMPGPDEIAQLIGR